MTGPGRIGVALLLALAAFSLWPVAAARADAARDYQAARAWHRNGQLERAVELYTLVIDSDQAGELRVGALNGRGIALAALSVVDLAIGDFAAAIELAPDDIAAWVNRGIMHRRLGNWEQSLADLDRAIDLDPENARTWAMRGRTWELMERHDEAIADYRQALELGPRNRSAQAGLARLGAGP